jgi:hypothetical protein
MPPSYQAWCLRNSLHCTTLCFMVLIIVVVGRKEVLIMGLSPLMKQNRDEQRDEIMKKTAAERLQIALELSDACILLNNAARRALEEKRAAAKA